MTANRRHPLDGGGAPAWAAAWGEDRFGAFAVLAVSSPDKAVEQRMRWIPPGAFLMGSRETERWRYGDEGPQHEVILSRGFWLGDTPVTQAMWIAVMGRNPSRFRREQPDGLERPVEQVSWDDCQGFISVINARVPGLGARLPTEAEWERACRAGTTGMTWVGDMADEHDMDELMAIAWYQGNSGDETRAVGRKAPNPYGLYDMLGNVWEWCWDIYDAEVYGTYRVLRGGGWFDEPWSCRASVRRRSHPTFQIDDVGFRIARSPV